MELTATPREIQESDSFGFKGRGRFIKSKPCVCEIAAAERSLHEANPSHIIRDCGCQVGSTNRPLIAVGEWSDNLTMLGTNTGRTLVLNRLNSDNTYTLNLLYADIGTASTAAAAADTQLGAAVARAARTSGAVATNVLTIKFFWSDANLTNGSYNEVGTFVDGTASINTGQIFNHIILASTYVKSAGEDSTLQVQITANAS